VYNLSKEPGTFYPWMRSLATNALLYLPLTVRSSLPGTVVAAGGGGGRRHMRY